VTLHILSVMTKQLCTYCKVACNNLLAYGLFAGEGSRRHGLEPPADVDRMLNDLMGSVLGSIVMGPLSQVGGWLGP
jgi:hypothetical protein